MEGRKEEMILKEHHTFCLVVRRLFFVPFSLGVKKGVLATGRNCTLHETFSFRALRCCRQHMQGT